MKIFYKCLSICVLGFGLISADRPSYIIADYNVIPTPKSVELKQDVAAFTLNSKTVVSVSDTSLLSEAGFLVSYIQTATSIKPKVSSSSPKTNVIQLTLGLDNPNPEAYIVDISTSTIIIKGSSPAGLWYGVQFLRKSLPPSGYHPIVKLPCVLIQDQPRFQYRGVMLDSARHMQDVDFIKKYIDALAFHNINTLHWHLTEDQGWRIEIKKHPRLTEIAAYRKQTLVGHGGRPKDYDGVPYGGFYTQEQIKDVVVYAAKRHITIIPEIDLPGHMLAALTAYPELGCTGGPYQVAPNWGVFPDVLCAGEDKIYTFLEDVLSEVMELFPSKYIHVGGDECPKTRWEECPKCQARIQELGLVADEHGSKEFKLQSHVITYVEKFINSKGRRVIGWDEILEGGLAPDATVMSWRGVKGAVAAAQQFHDAILSPNSHLYFDRYQSNATQREPLSIGGIIDVKKVFSFSPIPDGLTPEQSKHIIGVQANLWTEYIKTASHVEYMMFPRSAALAQIQWCGESKGEWEDFKCRLYRLEGYYKAMKINYAPHFFQGEVM